MAPFLTSTPAKIIDIVSDGDIVVVHFLGSFRASPESEPASISACELYSFRDGKVIDLRGFYWEPLSAEG